MVRSLEKELRDLTLAMEVDSSPVQPTRWQGMEVAKKPEAQMRELLHVNIQARLPSEHLGYYQEAVKPNLPWADDHFLERVGGWPINPGTEWANWPWGVSAEKSLDKRGMFNHNYMERYWPRYAGLLDSPTKNTAEFENKFSEKSGIYPQRGLKHELGDLSGVVRILASEPDTRQAFLPVWFPEDTGDAHMGRKPCTLGYHFILRNGQFDVVYYLRSCDFAHHMRDDIYLTIRLLLWVLDKCREMNPAAWGKVVPGRLVMQITSLHMFINDYNRMFK